MIIPLSFEENYPALVMIAMGISFVLWLTVLLSAIGLGSVTTQSSQAGIRHALWFGTALLGVLVGVVSLVPPAGSTTMAELLVIILALCGVAVCWRHLRRRKDQKRYLVVILTLLATLSLGTWMAIGEVRNYDTGLYHIQVIAIQARDGVDPGIAVLHDRFGFSSSLWAWGAVFERIAGPALGFRLVPGLFLLLLMADVILRMRNRRNRRAPGTWLVLLGTVPLLAYGISYPGRTFAGIGQDWIVAALWLLASAYALDWFTSGRSLDMGTAVVIAAVSGSVRSLGWLLVTGLVLLWAVTRRSGRGDTGVTWWVWIISSLSVATTLMRDALASGWLLFPASIFPLPVQWRVKDPTPTADAIESWARSPFAMDRAREFDDWFPEWLSRVWTDWFVAWLLLAIALAILRIALRRNYGLFKKHMCGRGVLALVTLQALILGFWFATAPDTRFAWGPILVLGGLVLLVATEGLRKRRRCVLMPWIPLMLVAGALIFSLIRDSDWWLVRPFGTGVVQVIELPRSEVTFSGGVARTIGPDDRCWRTFVPCVPWYVPGSASSPDY